MSGRWRGRKRLGKNICVGTEEWFGLKLSYFLASSLPFFPPFPPPSSFRRSLDLRFSPCELSKDPTNIIKCKCRGFRAILTRTSQFTNMRALLSAPRFHGWINSPSVRFPLPRVSLKLKLSSRPQRRDLVVAISFTSVDPVASLSIAHSSVSIEENSAITSNGSMMARRFPHLRWYVCK